MEPPCCIPGVLPTDHIRCKFFSEQTFRMHAVVSSKWQFSEMRRVAVHYSFIHTERSIPVKFIETSKYKVYVSNIQKFSPYLIDNHYIFLGIFSDF